MPSTHHSGVTFLTALVITVTTTLIAPLLSALDPRPDRPGTIIPLYSTPGAPAWTALREAKRRFPEVPVIAVINPADGIRTPEQEEYREAVAVLRDEGITPIGYLTSSYAARPVGEMVEAISRMRGTIPDLMGVFLDEMSNDAAHQGYYEALAVAAREAGMTLVVGNPGTVARAGLLSGMDVLVTRENVGPPEDCRRPGWQAGHHRRHFAMLGYGVTALDRDRVLECVAEIGWLYLTDDVLPNPWDTTPGYLPELFSTLDAAA